MRFCLVTPYKLNIFLPHDASLNLSAFFCKKIFCDTFEGSNFMDLLFNSVFKFASQIIS